MIVIVCRLQLERLIPYRGLEAQLRLPVELDECGVTPGVHQREGVNAKTSIMRSDRGRVRSDMAHMSMWVVSGISDAKSQNVSCADAA